MLEFLRYTSHLELSTACCAPGPRHKRGGRVWRSDGRGETIVDREAVGEDRRGGATALGLRPGRGRASRARAGRPCGLRPARPARIEPEVRAHKAYGARPVPPIPTPPRSTGPSCRIPRWKSRPRRSSCFVGRLCCLRNSSTSLWRFRTAPCLPRCACSAFPSSSPSNRR
jgi:hypothetical protein